MYQYSFIIGHRRENLRDPAGAAPCMPCNDVFRTTTGAEKLGMGRGNVNFDAIVELERGRGALFSQTFLCCALHVGGVCERKTVEGSD